jgi:hypothetical protein
MKKENNKETWTLNCPYYKRVFETLDELINDVMVSGMDPNYKIKHNGKVIKEKQLI